MRESARERVKLIVVVDGVSSEGLDDPLTTERVKTLVKTSHTLSLPSKRYVLIIIHAIAHLYILTDIHTCMHTYVDLYILILTLILICIYSHTHTYK